MNMVIFGGVQYVGVLPVNVKKSKDLMESGKCPKCDVGNVTDKKCGECGTVIPEYLNFTAENAPRYMIESDVLKFVESLFIPVEDLKAIDKLVGGAVLESQDNVTVPPKVASGESKAFKDLKVNFEQMPQAKSAPKPSGETNE